MISPEKLKQVRAREQRRGEQDAQALASRPAGKSQTPPIDPVSASEAARIAVAVQSLGEIGPPAAAAVPALISAYRNGWSLSPMAIPEALSRIAPNSPAAPDVVAALIQGLDAQHQANRLGAVEALGHFGADAAAAIPKLQALRENSNKSLRDAAAKSLAEIENQSKTAGGHEKDQRRRVDQRLPAP